MRKKDFLRVFALTLMSVFFTIITFSCDIQKPDNKNRVLIDTDAGNSIDDLYAIFRALNHPEFKVEGITATHYDYGREAPSNSTEISYLLIKEMLELSQNRNIPYAMGALKPLSKWHGRKPIKSEAVDLIISLAKDDGNTDKLKLVCIGALTNIASAVMIAPEIVPMIEVYCMGMDYNSETKVWNKNEFNAQNDINALDFLLNSNGLKITVMPATASSKLILAFDVSNIYLGKKDGAKNWLHNQWIKKYPGSETRTMWDLALLEAMINPELASLESVSTPPENIQREIFVYTAIDQKKMENDFWDSIK